jgi:hypothetical protein
MPSLKIVDVLPEFLNGDQFAIIQQMFVGVQLAQDLPIIRDYLLEDLSPPALGRTALRVSCFINMRPIIVKI